MSFGPIAQTEVAPNLYAESTADGRLALTMPDHCQGYVPLDRRDAEYLDELLAEWLGKP